MLTKVTIAIKNLSILHKATCELIFAGIYSITYELLTLHSELGQKDLLEYVFRSVMIYLFFMD